jgi:hypothetical protein
MHPDKAKEYATRIRLGEPLYWVGAADTLTGFAVFADMAVPIARWRYDTWRWSVPPRGCALDEGPARNMSRLTHRHMAWVLALLDEQALLPCHSTV